METIGKNIANLRKKAGFTQEELSEKMNVTSQAISKWENDLSYPDLASVKQLASVLNVSIEELINGEKECPVATDASEEQIARRIVMIRIQVDANEEFCTQATNVTIRIPVSALLNAEKNGTLKDLVGENASQVELSLGMIKEGVTGKLVDAQAENTHVEIVVEDYEN